MRRIIIVLFALSLFAHHAEAKKKETVDYSYELASVKGTFGATAGFRVFKVWSYCKKKELLTQDICMRNAIHGVLFKGLSGYDDIGGKFNALVPEGYEAHKDYFDHFFETGEYRQFIQLTSKGAQQAGDIIKTANKEWKVGLLVQVNVKALRKRLQKDNIIMSTTDIFRND